LIPLTAYTDTAYVLFLPALLICFLPLGAGFLTSNFYLGKTHNAIEDKVLNPSEEDEEVVTEKK
jgi:hypothetical protein